MVFGATATFWMTRLNRGLRLFPSTFIVPMMQAMWTVLSILNGGIYFKEFENFDTQRTVTFFSGVLIVLLSVLSLASGKASDTLDSDCNGDPERDSLLGGGSRTRTRSSSGGGGRKHSSFMFSLPCVPFLMSAQAVDLDYGEGSDAQRWEALNRERREASVVAASEDFCTLNAHGQYGFPGRQRRSGNDSSARTTPSGAPSGDSDGAKGALSRMGGWAWRVGSPRRSHRRSSSLETPPEVPLDEPDFFEAEGGS